MNVGVGESNPVFIIEVIDDNATLLASMLFMAPPPLGKEIGGFVIVWMEIFPDLKIRHDDFSLHPYEKNGVSGGLNEGPKREI